MTTRTPGDEADASVSDRRLLRGERSRWRVVRHAVDVASLEGLNGLSLGRLAADVGVSKSGIQTLFRSKENLQVAVVEYAREAFAEAVVAPAMAEPAGTARLRALIERWIAYAEAPLFAGGCFWAANVADFDSRPGAVRDVLFRHQRKWRALLATELRQAADRGEIPDTDAKLAAFQIDAALMAANIDMRLGDKDAGDTARHVLESFLRPR